MKKPPPKLGGRLSSFSATSKRATTNYEPQPLLFYPFPYAFRYATGVWPVTSRNCRLKFDSVLKPLS